MKKVSKTRIIKVLRTQNSTEIFKIAKMYGIDVSEKTNVYNFIKEFAPSQKVFNGAYRLSYGASDFKLFRANSTSIYMPIANAIRFAKMQKEDNWNETNYFKILIIGNRNIYWASPSYQHSDYNKSIAFENTPKNRILAEKINSYLNN